MAVTDYLLCYRPDARVKASGLRSAMVLDEKKRKECTVEISEASLPDLAPNSKMADSLTVD